MCSHCLYRIPYLLSSSHEFPGKFLLSYLPRKTTRHEFITVTPDGIRYRSRSFPSLTITIRWFKEHFRDPIPGMHLMYELLTAQYIHASYFTMNSCYGYGLWGFLCLLLSTAVQYNNLITCHRFCFGTAVLNMWSECDPPNM